MSHADGPAGRPHGRLATGDLLNGIYEIQRLIGRGGMAEVWEGFNVNGGERVAIKVMLPAFAGDPQFQSQFRKEARILTRLAHPALAQYRLLAEDPHLGVLYMVTEFVEGVDLESVLGKVGRDLDELRLLAWRLAGGLRSAHRLGAVHRDMSPDNVRLPYGRLEEAKIIDFGIAKDLQSTQVSLFNDSFVGKLGYAAPEQFGAYGAEIGAWTDVYSLGLVLLAVALGKPPAMGASPAEAVDRRRSTVDVSGAPASLQPLLARMLEPDPVNRLRSMDDVLELLGPPSTADAIESAEPTRRTPLPDLAPPARRPAPRWVWPAAAAAALLVAAAGGLALLPRPPPGPPAPPPAKSVTTAPPVVVSSRPPSAVNLTRVIASTLPTLPCSWLDLASDPASGDVVLVGVSGSPNDARNTIAQAARAAGVVLTDAQLDTSGIGSADHNACVALDALRATREPDVTSPRLLAIAETRITGHLVLNKSGADETTTLSIGDPSRDFALLGVRPSGEIKPIIGNRAALIAAENRPASRIQSLSSDAFSLVITADEPGWTGLLLITSPRAVDLRLLDVAPTRRDADWARKVQEAAKEGGWHVEMAWFDTLPAS